MTRTLTFLIWLALVTGAAAQQTDDCRCACVDGKVQAVCTSAIAIRPICTPRICDIVTPSIKPIDTPTIPPIGTNKCDLKQVLNEKTHEYEWQRLCDQTDNSNQPRTVAPSSEPVTNSSGNNQPVNDNQSGALGQSLGNAIRVGIAHSVENHHINSFCKANPTSTYVTGDGVRVDCPSASLTAFEQTETDSYCANNPGSWIEFGKHRVDCLTPPNPLNLKWAEWELKAWGWDYKNPKKINLSLSQDQMRSNWNYWQQKYCGLSGSGAKYKDLGGKKQYCP